VTRTSLTRYAPLMRDPDAQAARRRAAGQFHEDGTIILFPETLAKLSWQDRELLIKIAEKQYGKRKA